MIGQGDDMCSVATTVVVVACVVLTLCCCGWSLFGFFGCRRRPRRRCGHRKWIENLQCYASYRVFERPHDIDGETVTRTHVVWQCEGVGLDASTAYSDTIAAEEDVRPPAYRHPETEADSEVRLNVSAGGPMVAIDVQSPCSESAQEQSSSSQSDDSWIPPKGPLGFGSGRHYRVVAKSTAPSGSGSFSDTIDPLPSWVNPAYEDGSLVEYYSFHNDQWLLAVVSLAALHTEPVGRDSFVAVVYNVRIGKSQQLRNDVGLAFLRRPLEPMEPVEVRAPLTGVWQAAHILKVAHSSLGRSYMVSLDSVGVSVLVPGTSVRRRFTDGSAVHVYRGATDGWVLGVLEDGASADLTDCPDMALPTLPVKKMLGAHPQTEEHPDVEYQKFPVRFAELIERVPAYLMDSSVAS